MDKVFAIFDTKMNSYMNPQLYKTTEQAIRAFGNGCKQEGSGLANNPEDYAMHELGHFDDVKGRYENLKEPVSIARALDYVEKA
jgi:hypothetical protein